MSSALFTLTSEPTPSAAQQTALGFPEPLAEKYRPRAIADFVGLEKPRKILAKFLARPMAQSAWLFVGPPGLGKTTMGLALASELPAELHHIPARACDLERVRDIAQRCHYVPWSGTRLHLVLVDEADQMTEAAQLAFLSLLDATAFPPSTCFVFTANATDRLQDRFLSRCRTLEFSSYGIAADLTRLLEKVWNTETAEQGITAETPNFARIAKESCNNVRDALMKLELALLAA